MRRNRTFGALLAFVLGGGASGEFYNVDPKTGSWVKGKYTAFTVEQSVDPRVPAGTTLVRSRGGYVEHRSGGYYGAAAWHKCYCGNWHDHNHHSWMCQGCPICD